MVIFHFLEYWVKVISMAQHDNGTDRDSEPEKVHVGVYSNASDTMTPTCPASSASLAQMERDVVRMQPILVRTVSVAQKNGAPYDIAP